jgi:hypothetical protein
LHHPVLPAPEGIAQVVSDFFQHLKNGLGSVSRNAE